MDTFVAMLNALSIAAFGLLAVTGLARMRRGSEPDRWIAGAFASLAGVLVASLFLPERPGPWIQKVEIAVILAFPYFLYRFASTFRPVRRGERFAALTAFSLIVVVSMAIPEFPGSDEARPDWAWLYLGLFLAYWTALSAVVVVRLWRAGKGHPTLTRRRMRLMSLAAVGLNVGILIAGSSPPESAVAEVVVQVLVVLTALAFLLGFTPPRTLRLAWRTPEQDAAREAVTELMRAESATQVADVLLPHVAALAGSSGAALTDTDGKVVASHSVTPEMLEHLVDGRGNGSTRRHERIPISDHHGSLVVWTTAYTPFFGRDDLDAARDLGAVGALALERADLLEHARETAAAADLSRSAAERANMAKNEFLSSMSHELRTPLNAILGFGQLLQVAEIGEEDRDSADHIVKAGRHLLELVNEVLDLSRIEAGRLTLSPEAVRVDEVVGEAVHLMRPAANERGITLTAELARCAAHIYADRQRLKQVLLNLLSNAVKYNRDGGGVVVTCGSVSQDRLRISVRDTGPGIAPGRMSSLFEPFERLGAEGTAVEGTGLGLALARRLMEAMGGTIGVDSVDGEGSTFWLELAVIESPVEVYDRDNDGKTPSVAPAQANGRTVLLIEDNLSNFELVNRILKARPAVSMLSAMQSGLGLELARQHRPDLILLDLHLPDIPGEQVLHRLRADPTTRSIPVVIVSADATDSQIRRLLAAGATDYVTKPFDVHRLLGVVDAALQLQTPERT